MCLTCEVRDLIYDHYEKHGKRMGDQAILDATEAIIAAGRVIAELIAADPDNKRRTRCVKEFTKELAACVENLRKPGNQHMVVIMDDGVDVGAIH